MGKPAPPAKLAEPTAKPAVAAKATPPAKADKPAKSGAAPAPATSAKPGTTTPHYYINVGLFAQEANARSAHTKLLDAGLVAFTQDIKTPKGKMTRVRVGPFDSQSDADAAVERIRGLGLDAILFQQ